MPYDQKTLDALRAVLSRKNPIKIPKNIRYALWGYSGGAYASEWAAELQVQYAPELNIAGAALGGLTPNVSEVLYQLSGTSNAGIDVSGILGLATQWPDASAAIQADLKSPDEDPVYNSVNFNKAKHESTEPSYSNDDISKFFRHGFDVFYSPCVQEAINRDGVMGYHGTPQMPLFIYKAIGDEFSAVEDTDALVARYCGNGATIDYQRNTIGNHEAEYVHGDARAFEFLTSVLEGNYTATGCKVTTAEFNGGFSPGP